MSGQDFLRLYRRLCEFASATRDAYQQHSDLVIASVYLYSVLHDRPQGWGCHAKHWSIAIPWLALPSESCLSRRIKAPSVKALLDRLCDYLWGRFKRRMVRCIDGKALTVSKSSKDRTATIGPASGGKLAKGYKLHVIVDGAGVLLAWAVAPLNHSEMAVAKGLIRKLDGAGYLVGDSNYDYNVLYEYAYGHGHQLLAPPKKQGKALGHQRHSPRRLRGLALLAQPLGKALRKVRKTSVERVFGNLGWKAGGISQLPGFVRTLPRVRRFLQAKIIFHAIDMENSLELR